ncbi:MAG: hypothetical protein U1D30_16475 [Planctomycetota bacterium]
MRVTTLVGFLFGFRNSVLAVANCRQAAWLGLLFVISAGFAREYDAEDLLHDPWYLLLPVAASLVTSLILFLLVELRFSRRAKTEDGMDSAEPSAALPQRRWFWIKRSRYRSFLGLYWMTAPLAWLYAIPVERFLDAGDSARANLSLLGIVALWRVLLMSRVVSIIYRQTQIAALFVVLLFGDSIALAVLWLTPLPIFNIMGGIHLSEAESTILSTSLMVMFIGAVSWPVWLGGTVLYSLIYPEHREPWRDVDFESTHSPRVSNGAWFLGAASILVWSVVLPFTQPEQMYRRQVEIDLRTGRVHEAVTLMSSLRPADFPPHWDPPPRLGYGESEPSIIAVLLEIQKQDAPPWVRDLYWGKMNNQTSTGHVNRFGYAIPLAELDDQTLEGYIGLMRKSPSGPMLAKYHENEIRSQLRVGDEDMPAEPLSPRREELLRSILEVLPKDEQPSVDQ